MKKRNKRSQAFLISTVIIIMILTAFITISNYSRKTGFSTFPFIAEEIQIESEKVMDYALINNDDASIDSFTKEVSNFADKDTKIYFIIGEYPKIECYSYEADVKKPCQNYEASADPIKLTADGIAYEFPLTKGKHFYFLMIKESGGERYVFTNAK